MKKKIKIKFTKAERKAIYLELAETFNVKINDAYFLCWKLMTKMWGYIPFPFGIEEYKMLFKAFPEFAMFSFSTDEEEREFSFSHTDEVYISYYDSFEETREKANNARLICMLFCLEFLKDNTKQ